MKMCTAAAYKTDDFYFGRTLDFDFSYGDEITITPRNFPLNFRHTETIESHHAIIGTAHIADGYPLYYDAINEKGLGIAGLNFVGNAVYAEPTEGKINISQFELIPWILAQCATVDEVKALFGKTNLVGTPFSDRLSTAQLHWLIADTDKSITVESVADGLKIYDNPVGVLTNNPPFDRQMQRLNDFGYLSPKQPKNNFSDRLTFDLYSRGMGAIGLPGDLSSSSRFVRVAFTKMNSVSGYSEQESVSQFFHILGSVDQQRGCCEVADGKYEITIYTSCCNATKGIYYYTTYDNSRITAVDMHREDLWSNELIRYPMLTEESILWQN